MKILVVSNMGAKLSAPLLGNFVDQQVASLKANSLAISYFKMAWNGDSFFHKLLKYPLFFFKFIHTYIFSVEKFDIIHIHYYFPTIICAALYKVFRNKNVKVFVTCHGGDIYCYQPPSWTYKKLSYIVDHWLFTSQRLKERFYRRVSNADIVCAGYDDQVFNIDSVASDKSIDCLLVGNLDINKGLDRFIALVVAMPYVRFVVVGTGKFQAQLEQCALKNTNLTILGALSPKELAVIIKQSKCLLSLSRHESFGLVIAEANACGTPCIATQTDGSIEQLTDWPYLILQQDKDEVDIENQLKNKITELLNLDEVAYQALQNKAQHLAVAYSLSHITQVIKQLYLSQPKERKYVQ